MKLRPLLVSSLLVWLSGCAAVDWLTYKLPVNQGNIIEQKDIDKLRPGMTREQVVFVLGEPLARSSFQADRWEYVYTSVAGRQEYASKRLSALFANEQLVQVVGEGFLIPAGLGTNQLSDQAATPPASQPAASASVESVQVEAAPVEPVAGATVPAEAAPVEETAPVNPVPA